jgi:hypothetical protein
MDATFRNLSLREAVRLWEALGGTALMVRRTGELRFTHPAVRRSILHNARRKDASQRLVSAVRFVVNRHGGVEKKVEETS